VYKQRTVRGLEAVMKEERFLTEVIMFLQRLEHALASDINKPHHLII
jgi:hypothetical protein